VKKFVFGAAALTLVAACGQQSAPVPTAEPAASATLGSGIIHENMDLSVAPGDDFFSYVNGAWVAATEIPSDRSDIGTFGVLRDEAQANVKEIIEETARGDYPKGSDEQLVGDLYGSYMNMALRDQLGAAPMQPDLERIDAIKSHADLAVYFAAANKRGFDVPFGLGQNEDMKDPQFYMMYAWQGGLGLPDREYYFNDDDKSVEIRDKYLQHIATMFDLAGFGGGKDAAETIMALETRLAAEHMLKEQTRDFASNYNKQALQDLSRLMPNFNWSGYIEEAQIGDIDGLVLFMTDYMVALDEIIKDTDLETWKTYLRWGVLNTAATRLNAELDAQNFEFYSKTISGVEEQRDLWRRGVNIVNATLGELVGKVYVKKHFPPEAKARMEKLVANLLAAYEVSIRELDWMRDETKAEALDKLSKITSKIGYPDEWRDYSAIEIKPDDLYGNLQRAALAEYQRQLARQGGPVDKSEWSMTPQTVNAGYSPWANSITFPAAVLQPPFFNLAAEEAINYGAIGAGIGHEIGHGFDDSGSTFDGDGALRNWWTDEDRAEFEKRTRKLVAQFDEFQPFDDLSVNGEFTLGENIGDLGGVSIGLLAYKMSLNGAEAPVIDGFTGAQRVFIGYGQNWRNKYRDERLRQLIQTDPHAPSMYRANGAVRNVPEFYEAFDVQESNALYLPPEERVKIW
jgi:putative endopeptidase